MQILRLNNALMLFFSLKFSFYNKFKCIHLVIKTSFNITIINKINIIKLIFIYLSNKNFHRQNFEFTRFWLICI